MKKIAVGTDIGGSHVTCQLFDLKTHQLIRNTKVRRKVSGLGSATEILAAWAQSIKAAGNYTDFKNLAGIGFAMPGPFDYTNGIGWFKDVGKFNNLYGVNVRTEIKNQLDLSEDFPLRFMNDAACFAIGESVQGKAANYSRILAITLGTGFGTTFIDNHIPVAGKYGIPEDGFLYRVPFQESVADEYFSTRWFLKEYETATGNKIKGVKEIAEEAENNEMVAGIFKTFGENLGQFLAPWLSRFGANCLVIGGNISAAYPLFEKSLNDEFGKAKLQLTVFISEMQEDAALAGSAFLCDNSFYAQLINQ